jgi:exportin-T
MLSQLIALGKASIIYYSNTSIAPKLVHPLTRILFMEITVRYSAELLLQPELIPSVLEFFVGFTGIHSVEQHVRFRAWYLFNRLLRKMQGHLVSISEQILAAFSDLLQIRVTETSTAPNPLGDGDSDSDSEQQDALFDSQVYLFQSAGLLIASTQSSNFEVGQALLRSLSNNIQERVQASSIDPSGLLYVHHTVMAVGDIAKGFDEANEIPPPAREQAVNVLFIPATETILKALTRFEDSNLIRDAVSSE